MPSFFDNFFGGGGGRMSPATAGESYLNQIPGMAHQTQIRMLPLVVKPMVN